MSKIVIVGRKKKPNFVRQRFNRTIGIGEKWRRPRGRHSKMRQKFRGKLNVVSIGYKNPENLRGLNHKGLSGTLVNNLGDLKNVEGNIIIGRTVGQKKRIEIIKKAIEKKIKILNLENPEAYLKDVTERLKKKKEAIGVKKESKPEEIRVEKKEDVSEEERKKKELDIKRNVLEGK